MVRNWHRLRRKYRHFLCWKSVFSILAEYRHFLRSEIGTFYVRNRHFLRWEIGTFYYGQNSHFLYSKKSTLSTVRNWRFRSAKIKVKQCYEWYAKAGKE